MIQEMIKLDQMQIHVRHSLNDKPVILFLHFSGGNLNMWEGILPQFENEFGVIAPDLRGHGKSDKPLTGYHIDDMANDMVLLLDKLSVRRCHIVGSSMGAEVGLSIAASHPGRVQSLVCEGAFCNEFGEYGLFDGTDQEIERKKQAMRTALAKREERVFKTIAEYVEEQRAQLLQQGLWNDNFLAFFENNLQPMQNGGFTYCYSNHVRTQYIENYWDVKFEQYYQKMKCPVLLLPSQQEWEDEKIRRSLSAFTSYLHTHETQQLQNSIHAYVWMQQPLAAGQAVKRFIRKYEQ